MPPVFAPATASTPVLRSSLLSDVGHAFSTRVGGVSAGAFTSLNLGMSTGDGEENVLTNRSRFFEAAGATPRRTATGRLTHGDAVAVFRQDSPSGFPARSEPVHAGSPIQEQAFYADAVVSDVPGMSFFMTFADCVPLVFHDLTNSAIGLAHAGWRGTALGIASTVVQAMQVEFGTHPRHLRAVIGPSIGPCCYEVGENVSQAFEAHDTRPELVIMEGRTHLDLWATNRAQLVGAGLDLELIDSLQLCTGCNVDTFYSHRREHGRTGRLGAYVGLPGPA